MSARLTVLLGASIVLSAWTSAASAQSTSAQRADDLFRSGKDRLAAGDLEVACVHFSDSYALDPATGGLLALAMCHERQHRLVTAIGEYTEVARRSHDEGRTDRERAANDKVAALERKVSSLTVYVTHDPAAPVVVVRLNEVLLTPSQLGTRLPIDGDVARVEASAQGRQTWRTSVALSSEPRALVVTVPVLAPEPGALPVAAVAPFAAQPVAPKIAEAPRRPATATARERERDKGKIARYSGLGMMAGGAVSLVMSAGFTIRAAKLRRDSDDQCDGNMCTVEGRATRLDARSAGTAATITLAAGAALATAGALTYWFGRGVKRTVERPLTLRASGWALPHSAGAVFAGSF